MQTSSGPFIVCIEIRQEAYVEVDLEPLAVPAGYQQIKDPWGSYSTPLEEDTCEWGLAEALGVDVYLPMRERHGDDYEIALLLLQTGWRLNQQITIEYTYITGKDPDTWNGPGDYWTDIEWNVINIEGDGATNEEMAVFFQEQLGGVRV